MLNKRIITVFSFYSRSSVLILRVAKVSEAEVDITMVQKKQNVTIKGTKEGLIFSYSNIAIFICYLKLPNNWNEAQIVTDSQFMITEFSS